jgi:hypothetical protein
MFWFKICLLLLIMDIHVSQCFLTNGVCCQTWRRGVIAGCRKPIFRINGVGSNNDAAEDADKSASESESKNLFANIAGIESETKRRSEEKSMRQGEATETLKREFSSYQNDASKAGFLKGATNPLRLSKQNDLGRLVKQANQAANPGQLPVAEDVPTDVESAVIQVIQAIYFKDDSMFFDLRPYFLRA